MVASCLALATISAWAHGRHFEPSHSSGSKFEDLLAPTPLHDIILGFTYNLQPLLVKHLRSYTSPPLAGPTSRMNALVVRDSTTCEGSKQWYVCSAGNFRGCCATDPCTSGICLDDGMSWLSLSSTSSSTTSRPQSTSTVLRTSTYTVPETTSQTTSSTTKVVSSETSTTTVATSPESSSSRATSSSTTTATAAASTGTTSSSKGPIIGGAIAGIVTLALFILLLWLCWRRKKRYGKSYRVRLLRSHSNKSLYDREMASASKTSLPPVENMSTNLHEEAHNSFQTTSPPSTSNAHSGNLSATNSTTALSLTLSTNPSENTTVSSAVLTTSSGGFIHLSPLRMPSPETETRNSLATAELSDTGFYRQRAELSANPSRELINVPTECRRRKSPLAQAGSSWTSSPSSSSSNGGSPRPADDKNGNSTLTIRQTARRVVTRDGVVMGANLDRYSTVRDSERGEKGKLGDGSVERDHVMSFMTFGRNEVEAVRRDEGNNSLGTGKEVTRAAPQTQIRILEDASASPVGEAPPAYEVAGVSLKQDDKSLLGTIGCGG